MRSTFPWHPTTSRSSFIDHSSGQVKFPRNWTKEELHIAKTALQKKKKEQSLTSQGILYVTESAETALSGTRTEGHVEVFIWGSGPSWGKLCRILGPENLLVFLLPHKKSSVENEKQCAKQTKIPRAWSVNVMHFWWKQLTCSAKTFSSAENSFASSL